MTRSIDIGSEPRGRTYEALVDYLGNRCSSFSLVWREQLSFEEPARVIADRLRPFLIREERTNEWPGTRLSGHMATVRHYRSTQDSLAVLKRQASLFSWEASASPEDLAFYDNAGACVFGSVSHEKDAWFNQDLLNADDIKTGIPGIELGRSGA